MIYYAVIFRKLFPEEEIRVNELKLNNQANELIAIAAVRFYKDIPEALPSLSEKDLFTRLTEKYAMKYFALGERLKKPNPKTDKMN